MADATNAINVVELSSRDRRELVLAAATLRNYDLRTDPERYVTKAQLLSDNLSEQLRRDLLAFRRYGHRCGGLVISGVPVGDVPPTPDLANASVGVGLDAAAAMSVLVARLGDQLGYRPELGGALVQDVLPVRGFETEQISTGSAIDLKTHIEMAFSDYRSDYVALLCVRPDHENVAGTTLSSTDEMLPLLDPATVEVLRQPRFRTKVDKSFLQGDGLEVDIWVKGICVLSGPAKRPHLRVDFAETEGTDDEAVNALDALNEAAGKAQLAVHLKAGDLIIADNHRALHGRTPFTPRYDGSDRWLLRTFVTKDLRRSEAERPGDGRVLEPSYSPPTEEAGAAARIKVSGRRSQRHRPVAGPSN